MLTRVATPQLGAAGMLAVELTGQGNWIDAPLWAVNGGKPTYLGNEAGVSDPLLLAVIELAFMGFAEKLRGAETGEKRIYPGGQFDPMGMSNDKSKLAELQLKEIKNGRLAMVACMGCVRLHRAGAGACVHVCSVLRPPRPLFLCVQLLLSGRGHARGPARGAGQAPGQPVGLQLRHLELDCDPAVPRGGLHAEQHHVLGGGPAPVPELEGNDAMQRAPLDWL